MSFFAILFHNAAIIMLPIYFINNLNLTKRKLILANIIFIPTILISFFNISVMQIFDFLLPLFENPVASAKAENLLTSDSESSIGIFHTLEYFLIMLFIIINFEKVVKVDKHSMIILKLFLILLPIFTLFSGYG
ncbi:hypothetical protein BB777_03655 [Planococcus faecalis]|nr:hypothetical protein BB777_03655 [Planococcus faecalis]